MTRPVATTPTGASLTPRAKVVPVVDAVAEHLPVALDIDACKHLDGPVYDAAYTLGTLNEVFGVAAFSMFGSDSRSVFGFLGHVMGTQHNWDRTATFWTLMVLADPCSARRNQTVQSGKDRASDPYEASDQHSYSFVAISSREALHRWKPQHTYATGDAATRPPRVRLVIDASAVAWRGRGAFRSGRITGSGKYSVEMPVLHADSLRLGQYPLREGVSQDIQKSLL